MTIPQNKKKQRRRDATAKKMNERNRTGMMLMQMKNTEILSPNLQRATFLGSAIVRSTPQIKDKKQKTKYGAAACKCSGAYKPKTQTNNPDYGCLLD